MLTPNDSIDAAELALGLLDGDERAAALRRFVADRAFAAEVDRWHDHFATLFPHYAQADPAEGMESRVATVDSGQDVAPLATSGDARWWKGATAVASIAAAALFVALVARPPRIERVPAPPIVAQAPPPTRTHALVAAIAPSAEASGTKKTPFGAVYDPDAGTIRVAAGLEVPAGHSAELWGIGGDGVPHAIGLLDAKGSTRLTVATALRDRLAEGTVIAISIEPQGGSPKDTPTGPVVATGALA